MARSSTTRLRRSPRLAYNIGATRYVASFDTRHPTFASMRAVVLSRDGESEVAPQLARDADSWTQFASWDARRQAYAAPIVSAGRHDARWAEWEQEHRSFAPNFEGWSLDSYLVGRRKTRNVTGGFAASEYKSGLRFISRSRYVFQAIIGETSHIIEVDARGAAKRISHDFAYGVTVSPNSRRIAFHDGYKVFVANSDGSELTHVETGQGFNFGPVFSPDNTKLLFLGGANSEAADIWMANADGAEPRKIASRAGFCGARAIMDNPDGDFHGGSSDVPVWGPDSDSVVFTGAVAGGTVEVMTSDLHGRVARLTHSPRGVWHAWPEVSPDGASIAAVSNRLGSRDIFILPTSGRGYYFPITAGNSDRGYLWPRWRPDKIGR